jgi:hypothetical protein
MLMGLRYQRAPASRNRFLAPRAADGRKLAGLPAPRVFAREAGEALSRAVTLRRIASCAHRTPAARPAAMRSEQPFRAAHASSHSRQPPRDSRMTLESEPLP